ncbi:hypothetical protein GCM10027063_20660 [Promicromonospora xylanilytica]
MVSAAASAVAARGAPAADVAAPATTSDDPTTPHTSIPAIAAADTRLRLMGFPSSLKWFVDVAVDGPERSGTRRPLGARHAVQISVELHSATVDVDVRLCSDRFRK